MDLGAMSRQGHGVCRPVLGKSGARPGGSPGPSRSSAAELLPLNLTLVGRPRGWRRWRVPDLGTERPRLRLSDPRPPSVPPPSQLAASPCRAQHQQERSGTHRTHTARAGRGTQAPTQDEHDSRSSGAYLGSRGRNDAWTRRWGWGVGTGRGSYWYPHSQYQLRATESRASAPAGQATGRPSPRWLGTAVPPSPGTHQRPARRPTKGAHEEHGTVRAPARLSAWGPGAHRPLTTPVTPPGGLLGSGTQLEGCSRGPEWSLTTSSGLTEGPSLSPLGLSPGPRVHKPRAPGTW